MSGYDVAIYCDAEGRPGIRIPGWPFMSFWQTRREGRAFSHQYDNEAGEGAGDDELFPGRAVAEPAPLPSTMLGLSPSEYEARLRRYGKRRW